LIDNVLSFLFNHFQVGLAVGGLDIQQQESVLRQSPDIVIATPGRLIDHLGNTPTFSLSSIEILILDEADR
jgi:ATP-dependent RNA helicase DDX27